MTASPAFSMREDTGTVGLEYVLAVGLLLLPVAMLVLQIAPWLQHRSVAELAAAEATRALVLVDVWPDDPAGALQPLVSQIEVNHELRPGALIVEDVAGDLVRGTDVTVTVSVAMPAFTVPMFGVEVGSFRINYTHTERIDDYRGIVEATP